MTYNNVYQKDYKAIQKIIDDELQVRYKTQEALPGEDYTHFKKRMTKGITESIQKEIDDIVRKETDKVIESARKIYPAWIKMPNETSEEFRKRLVSKSIEDIPTYPAWKKSPTESKEEFRKRFTKLQ